MSDDAEPADQFSSRERGAVIAGRYRIEHEIGRGGMATVFLAHDIRHDRQVALKFIHAEVADRQATERFRREIALLARLQHPHILPLYDSGESDGALFYVMPYIGGESLRGRIAREKRLPVSEAVRLACEIADALAYAHAHDIIHRDIKPENILLSEGPALVGYFGIGRAVSRAGGRRLSDAGFAIGTLSYMSPEPWAGDAVDGRSDLYSLGCVVYEMLAGVVPFSGPSAVAILAQRFGDPAMPLRKRRAEVPPGVDAAVLKALEPVPANRFESMAAFSAALGRAEEESAARANAKLVIPPLWKWIAAVAGLAALAALFFAFRPAPLDPGLYVVLPFVHRAGAAPQLLDGDNCQQLLYEAFGRWNGVTLVDDMRAHDARARVGSAPLSLANALRTARSLRAGRMAWGEVWSSQENINVRGLIYDVSTERPIKQYTVTLRGDLGDAERKFDELADTLLVPVARSGRATLPASAEGVRGTRSIPALTAYFHAHEALAAWELDSAQSLFRSALELDPDYPHANYWLAQVMAWRGEADAAEWLPSAQRAVSLSSRLSPHDSALAGALLSLAHGTFPDACARYERLRASKDSLDFAVWYGLGDCRARDTLVVKSSASPSGWRFRSGYATAITAYTRALELVPSAHRAFAGPGFSRLAQLLFTESNQLRRGGAASDSSVWAAFPSLWRDTVAFVPYPYADIASGRAARPPSTTAAVARNRERLERLATRWTQEFPNSAAAHEALARTLEMEGRIGGGGAPNATALAALDRARSLATDDAERRRLTLMRTRLLLVSGDFSGARALADSMLRAAPTPDPIASDELKPLAALTGRENRTIEMLRASAPSFRFLTTEGRIVQPALPVTEAARSLLGYASFGSPADSVGSSRQHVERALESYVPAGERPVVREAVLNRALTLAYPVNPSLSLQRQGGGGDYLLEIQHAATRGDGAAVHDMLHAIARTRALERPGELSIYLTYQEAWLLLQVGDTAAATRELDASLNALPALGPFLLDHVEDAAFLVRAMALRSDLAAKAGDARTAQRWGTAVAELWADADAPLQEIVTRMRARAAPAKR
ncbi:MAG: protein kinase [Gemmatimonadetes bacterium]|nr:protein kinase [Gemmatimonadota bacterium]